MLSKFSYSIFPFVPRPHILFYNVTQRCNLRCAYCFGQYYADQKELSLAEGKKLLIQQTVSSQAFGTA